MAQLKKIKPRTKQRNGQWQLHTAKAQFRELFRRACTEGPQVVTGQGKEQVVVVRSDQYAKLTRCIRRPKRLVKFFAESPLTKVKLDLTRDVDTGQIPYLGVAVFNPWENA